MTREYKGKNVRCKHLVMNEFETYLPGKQAGRYLLLVEVCSHCREVNCCHSRGEKSEKNGCRGAFR